MFNTPQNQFSTTEHCNRVTARMRQQVSDRGKREMGEREREREREREGGGGGEREREGGGFREREQLRERKNSQNSWWEGGKASWERREKEKESQKRGMCRVRDGSAVAFSIIPYVGVSPYFSPSFYHKDTSLPPHKIPLC